MTDRVWLPLQGEHGERPKAPAVSGWQSPSFVGIELIEQYKDWFGLRTDGLVVIDCDNDDAARHWRSIDTSKDVCVRKTPRGYHFIYRQTPDSPDAPAVGVFPGIDVRAGRTSQIVFGNAPGYHWLQGDLDSLTPFRPVWLPAKPLHEHDGEDWDEIPFGRGNNTMTAIAGALRRQGAGPEAMAKVLLVCNNLLMPTEPMPSESVMQIAMSVSRYSPDPDIDIEIDIESEDDESIVLDDDRPWLSAKNMQLMPPPEWLWYPYLPKGRLVMLDGQEGIGKGMFCVWAACRVAGGQAFPGVSDPPGMRPVLWFSAEDDPQEDILRRLLAGGYDQTAHAHILFRNQRMHDKFPRDIDKLERDIAKAKPALVILDPGRSYLGPEEGVEMSFNNEAALRPGLERLMHLAHKYGTTILFVHHWNKREDGGTRGKMGGSVAFLQVVRHRIALASTCGQSAFSVEKSNIAPKTGTVHTYSVEPVPDMETARFDVGVSLDQYRDLDEWVETVEKLDVQVAD